MAPHVCVLGAGVVGLTTALELQDRLPGARVTLLAEKFNTETTSDGAAGLYCPSSSFKAATPQMERDILRDSYEHYAKLQKEFGEHQSGIMDTEGYILSNLGAEDVRVPLIEDVVPDFKVLTPEELLRCPGNYAHGSYFKSFIIQGRIFLPFALAKFQKAGGRVVQRRVESLQDLPDLPGLDCDVLVNCSGLGARQLLGDTAMVPIRGQVIKVSAPWQKQFFLLDNDVYIIPGVETTLGGSKNYDSYDLEVDRHMSARIWERTTAVLPELRGAPIVREWVGLRPHRVPLRLEGEVIPLKTGGALTVVHNYGHGGQGVTTAPGCAKQAVDLVEAALHTRAKL